MVSEKNKEIAKYILKNFGGKFEVRAYNHDNLPLKIDIFSSKDRPDKGVTSYSTIGLSDNPMLKDGKEFPTRIELVGACATNQENFPNILAAAFCIIRTKKIYSPGTVLQGYVKEYYKKTTVPDLYLTAPFLWKKLKSIDIDKLKISFLIAIPISSKETELLKTKGDDYLEDLFEKNQIDIYDLNRKSVV